MDDFWELRPAKLSIGGTALIIGAIAFAIGFLAPLVLYPESNLGPLLGIFITGPVGFLAGALLGVVRSSRSAVAESLTRRELTWLAAVWLLALLFAFAFPTGGFGWIALTLQVATVATAAYVLYGERTRPLPRWVLPFRGPILVAGVLSVLASVFLPVVDKEKGEPKFAMFLDPRFDASYDVPEFTVDRSALTLEWSLFFAAALAIGFAILAFRNQRAS